MVCSTNYYVCKKQTQKFKYDKVRPSCNNSQLCNVKRIITMNVIKLNVDNNKIPPAK